MGRGGASAPRDGSAIAHGGRGANNAGMRCLLRTLWPLVVVAWPACARPAAAARTGDTLVLEVGGEQGSLRQALVAAGVLAPGRRTAEPEQVVPVEPADVPPEPEVAPPPAPDHIMVELGAGETLIHLAKRHLGDGNRFRDILTANGWTEGDARRLPAGQMVRIPVRAPSGR
jgi:hypothetical protein